MEMASQDVNGSRAAESGNSNTQEDPEIALDVFLSTPVVERIPRACRNKVAVVLTEAIRSVVEDPNYQGTWKGLLQFAGTCICRL